MESVTLTEVLFADDMALVAASEETLKYNWNILNEGIKNINMRINMYLGIILEDGGKTYK